jgi:preprotein translocase subunit SecA
MDIDEDKIDEAALALLYLTLHEQRRAWKQLDWNVTNRLHEKGFILDPISKTKSVVLTDEGLKKSEQLFKALFSKQL